MSEFVQGQRVAHSLGLFPETDKVDQEPPIITIVEEELHLLAGFALAVLLTGIVAAGCSFTAKLEVVAAKSPAAPKMNLHVTVIVPESSRSFTQSRPLPCPCSGQELMVVEPAPYGEIFVKVVADRFSRIFRKLSVVRALPAGQESDAIFEASLTNVGYLFGCLVAPDQFAAVEGKLRAFNRKGEEVWRFWASWFRHENPFQYMRPPTGLGSAASHAIAKLVEGWTRRLVQIDRRQFAAATDRGPANAPSKLKKSLRWFRARRGSEIEEEGLPHGKEALRLTEMIFGPAHTFTATVLSSLADSYHALDRFAEAEPHYRRSLAIYEMPHGPGPRWPAPNLEELLEWLDAFDLAAGVQGVDPLLYWRSAVVPGMGPGFWRSTVITVGRPAQEHLLARVLGNYAALMRKTGRGAEADKLEARARAIRAKTGKN